MLNQKTVKLGVVGAFLATIIVMGPVLAQTTSATPLSCNFGLPSVRAGEPAVLTASGGNGFYGWSGQGLSVTNPTGSRFTVTYNMPGTYQVTVASGNETANCTVIVTPNSSAMGTLNCAPLSENVSVGQPATFSATGGSGDYLWSGDSLAVTNPTGSSFQATYTIPGSYNIRVMSGGQIATCAAVVTSAAGGGSVGLPNTGGGGAAR